jgi:hypothetical protein
MILTLWIALLSLAGLLVAFGYFTGDEHYAFVGLFFFFMLGMYVLTNQLSYQIGSNMTAVANGNTTTTVTTYNYTVYNDLYTRSFGLFLAISSAWGMVLSFFKKKTERDSE